MTESHHNSYLSWCRALESLKSRFHTYFTDELFHPFYSPILQPSVGFDPTNTVYKLENPDGSNSFLRTSPERFMKVALSQTQTSLYEIGKVFRGGTENNVGPIHVQEFWMCEWYEIDTKLDSGIERCRHLIKTLWHSFRPQDEFRWQIISFDVLFHDATGKNLSDWLKTQTPESACSKLDFIYADQIHPLLAKEPGFTTLTGFPSVMAALANPNNPQAPWHERRHNRWETSFSGIELLNGYEEITEFEILQATISDQPRYLAHAKDHGQLWDPTLIAALKKGIPSCTGCALGLDRLLMVLLGQDSIPVIH